jgi:hypothetical protein
MRTAMDEDEHQPLKKAKRLKPKGLRRRIAVLDTETHEQAMERLCESLEHTHPSRTSQDS